MYFIAFGAILAFNLGLAIHASRIPMRVDHLSGRAFAVILGNAAMITLLGRLFTPFLIAPGVASVTAAVLLASPAFRSKRGAIAVVVVFAIAVMLPWIAEVIGVISPTIRFSPEGMTLMPTVVEHNPLAVAVGLSVWAPGMAAVTAFLTMRRTRVEDEALRHVHCHAWRLAQLVPR